MAGKPIGRRAHAAFDAPTETIQKMLPLEVVAFYVAAQTIVPAIVGEDAALILMASWIIFGVGLVATPLYMMVTWDANAAMRREALSAAIIPQLVIGMVAFVVWAFALGGPFTSLAFWREWMGGLALLVGVLLLTGISALFHSPL